MPRGDPLIPATSGNAWVTLWSDRRLAQCPAEDTTTAKAKMVAALCIVEMLQPHTTPGAVATDPASPEGIAQAVVTLLGPTLTATVDSAVHRGLEQLHIELQAQARESHRQKTGFHH